MSNEFIFAVRRSTVIELKDLHGMDKEMVKSVVTEMFEHELEKSLAEIYDEA